MVVLGLPLSAHLLRGALDTWVLPSSWYITSFAATLLVARMAGVAAGLVSAAVAVALVSVDPPVMFPARTWITLVPPLPSREVALEMLTVVAGVGLGSVIARVREVHRPSLAMLENAIGRRRRIERELRDLGALARSLAGPTSPRQVADQLARVGLAIADADAAVVVSFGADRGAGATGSDELAATGRADALGQVRAVAAGLGPDDPATGTIVTPPRHGDPDVGADDATEVTSIALPLVAGIVRVGALVVGFSAPRTVDQRTLDVLDVAARLGGEALSRSRNVASGRVERRQASAAADRVARLQAIARELAPAVDAATVARSVVDVATDALGARVGLLYRRSTEPDRLELLHARGYPPGLARSQATLPVDANLPAAEVVRERRGLLVTADEWASRFPGASDLPSIVSLTRLAAEPLGDDPVRGALVVGWGGDVTVGPDERRFLAALAAHASAALARTDLVDALRDRQRRLDATLEVASAGAWDLDLERDQLELSPEFLRIRGRPEPAEDGGLAAYLALVHPDDRLRVRATIDEAARTLGPYVAEFQAAGVPGAPPQWIRSEGWVSAEGPNARLRLTGIDRDVSAERHVEQERERALESERDARALQDAFIGVMSHELRTPITTILAAARLLLRGGRSAESARDLGSDISSEAERLHRLVDDLLVMSRIERGSLVPDREPVHLRRLLERVVHSESIRWPETRFELAGPPRGDVIAGEETYVEQVLRNLLTNAAKYAGADTTVTVEVEAGRDEIAVRVLDQGPGVSTEEVEDLFALFYRSATTAASASGAGIGLFVCDRLIRAMHGRIWARPRPGGGSEFGFALARYRDEDDFDDLEDDLPGTQARDADASTAAETSPTAASG